MITTGMEAVIALENAIRAGLPKAPAKVAAEARALLAGRWPATGTRLAALQDIAGRLK